VIQKLSQGDGGSVGTPLAVVESVDNVAGEVTPGGIVEPAAALIGQRQQGGGGHHLGDTGDAEGHLGVQTATVVAVCRRGPGPTLGPTGRLDPQKTAVNPWEQPAGGGLGDHSIQRRRPTHALSSRVAHGGPSTGWFIGPRRDVMTEAKSLTLTGSC
jgi:hypothetical protein